MKEVGGEAALLKQAQQGLLMLESLLDVVDR